MPLSGIFFVFLNHQSNRKTMFKKTDSNPQLDMFTAPSIQLGVVLQRSILTPTLGITISIAS